MRGKDGGKDLAVYREKLDRIPVFWVAEVTFLRKDDDDSYRVRWAKGASVEDKKNVREEASMRRRE